MGSFGWCVEFRLWLLTAVLLALLGGLSLAAGGDAGNGARLFSGAEPMANGGAPCVACHAVAGLGVAGLASYGPDLSDFYEDYDEDGVMAVLEAPDFPSMSAIFEERPLTEGERRDLTAYFATTADARPAARGALAWQIPLGVVVVFVLLALSGRRRFKGVRQPLVDSANKKRGALR